MGRCDYDVIFYRVFCLTLLGIAFIFTVVLTNVFVDIDGLLARKDGVKTPVFQTTEKIFINPMLVDNPKSDILYKEYDYEDDDEDEAYRSKRSLESSNFLFHIKNPTMKNILTNRLETLLEELDAEESTNIGVEENKSKEKVTIQTTKGQKRHLDKAFDQNVRNYENLKYRDNIEMNENNNILEGKKEVSASNEDMLYLTMHHIILQGIIGHMNLNDVYKNINNLYKKFDDNNKGKNLSSKQLSEVYNFILKRQQTSIKQKTKFFEELMKCKELQKQITQIFDRKENIENKKSKIEKPESEEPKVQIKTVIDIKSQINQTNKTDPKEVKNIIELIYNGKPVQINGEEVKSIKTGISEISDPRILKDTYENYRKSVEETFKTNAIENLEDIPENIIMSKSFVTKVVEDYLKKYYVRNLPNVFNSKNMEIEGKLKTKRMKRHIKIKYNVEHTNQTKENNITKNNDDELYVEIETHFDSKGMKGERKKKLIRELIDKIRKAIHSESPETNKSMKHKHVKVKKRIQNPLDFKHETKLIHEEAVPLKVVHRHIEPIGKFIAREENLRINDKFGDNWKQPYIGPRFLTASKSLDSAQLGEVDIDYNKLMNSIPQRVQMPLNTDTSEEMLNSNTFNVGNMNFIIKDIDGSGFSVGFNQYTDAAPDPEAMKLFTRVENLVKAYHQNYDEVTSRENEEHNNIMDVSDKNLENMGNSNKLDTKPDEHTIIRRSPKDITSHFNELELDFKHLYTRNYEKNTIVKINKDKTNDTLKNHEHKNILFTKDKLNVKILPYIINSDIFDQNLKPEEIYNLASLFDRKKRTIAVKKYTNRMSNKIKINRFLNTNKTVTKRVIIKKKRNKRNVGRIEVMTSDDANKQKQSEERIYVLSDENLLADRATIHEIETPDDIGVIDLIKKNEPQYDLVHFADTQPDLPFAYIPPQNPLMSKYPHIFMEEDSYRYDDLIPEVFDKLRTIPHLNGFNANVDEPHVINDKSENLPMTATTKNYIQTAESIPRVEEIVNAISPNSPKTKYKFTVKIIPNQNMTGLNSSGFKEIHASINKSLNKDGLMYSTLINMTEISKIEDLFKESNKETKLRETAKSTTVMPIHMIQKIRSMIKNHKARVDQQLDHLQKERAHLDLMMIKNDAVSNDYVDIMLPSKPPQKIHLKASDVNKLAASALITLQEQQNTQTPLITETTSVTTTVTTSSTTTQTTVSPERIRIIKTIEKNDNLTKEILNKIDKNTEMLQTFLVKLSDSFPNLRQLNHTDNNKAVISSDKKEWTLQPEQTFDKPTDSHNMTNYRIPFLYAYQQPYGFVNKPDSPMASIIYKGHIHTNTIERPADTVANININKLNTNSSDRGRFFIDDIESGYRGHINNSTKIDDHIKVNNTVHRLV